MTLGALCLSIFQLATSYVHIKGRMNLLTTKARNHIILRSHMATRLILLNILENYSYWKTSLVIHLVYVPRFRCYPEELSLLAPMITASRVCAFFYVSSSQSRGCTSASGCPGIILPGYRYVAVVVVLRNMSYPNAQGKFSTLTSNMSLLTLITYNSGYSDLFTLIFPVCISNSLVPKLPFCFV
jgi:hypothetical protein